MIYFDCNFFNNPLYLYLREIKTCIQDFTLTDIQELRRIKFEVYRKDHRSGTGYES